MTEFSDLSDDCLIEVLDRLPAEELFKMQRLNTRLKRLAAVKMQTNIKVIGLNDSEFEFFECTHLGSISRNEVLVLDSMFKKGTSTFQDISKKLLFLSVLTKCQCVKSIHFGQCEMTSDVLLEVVRRCPQLECIKLEYSFLDEDDWCRVFDELGGHKIVHFEKTGYADEEDGFPSAVGLVKAIAAKCKNIKLLDLMLMDWALTNNMVSAFKMLPKSCWISFDCDSLEECVVVLEDVFDLLNVSKLKWSALDGRCYDRLSGLKFELILDNNDHIRGVDFAGLKTLDYHSNGNVGNLKYLFACRFPKLEVFKFDAFGINENDYDALFQRMPSIKQLFFWNLSMSKNHQIKPYLPKALIHRLKNLETIFLEICFVADNWQPDDFLKQMEQYVDETSVR